MRCGKALKDKATEYCFDCENQRFYFTRNRSVFAYCEEMKRAVHAFKYKHRKECGIFFGEEIAEALGDWMKRLKVDALLPVPLHKKRKRGRGYNQAAVMAEVLGRRLGVPVDTKLVYRSSTTKPQKELSRKERKINVKNAFKISKNEIQYERVLLIDDIYTTGATLDSISEQLKAAGIKEIYCITLCIGKGY